MPKLPEFTPQTRITGNLRRLPEVSGGQAQAEALAGLSTSVGELGKVVKKREERKARIDNEKLYSEARLKDQEEFDNLVNDAPPGGVGLTEQASEAYDKRTEQLIEEAQKNNPGAQANDEIHIRRARNKSRFMSRAATTEANLAAEHQTEQVEDTLENNNNAVLADPSLLDETLEHNNELIAGVDGVDATTKEQWKTEQRERTTLAAGEGRLQSIESVPQADAFLDEFKKNGSRWQRDLSEKAYASLLSRIQRRRAELDRAMESEYLQGFDEWERQTKSGVITDDYTREDIEALVSDPEQREEFIRRYETAVAIGDATQRVQDATPAEIEIERNKLVDATESGDTENFDENVERLRYLDAAVERREKQLEADAAGYVLERSSRGQQLWNALFTEDTDREDVEAYVAFQSAEQRRLRGPDAQLNLLPASYVAGVQNAVDDIGSSDEAQTLLQSEREKWGDDNWPAVVGQLQREGVLNGTMAVAAEQPPAIARELLRADRIGEDELEKQLENRGEDMTDADQVVADEMRDLTATIPVDSPRALRNAQGAVKKRALYIARRDGISYADAVEQSADEMYHSNYEYVGTYRIPVDEEADTITQGAYGVRQTMESRDFLFPLDGSKEDAANMLADEGQWRTAGDESGLVLTWPNGQRVEDITGRPFKLTWAELSQFGAKGSFSRPETVGRQRRQTLRGRPQ